MRVYCLRQVGTKAFLEVNTMAGQSMKKSVAKKKTVVAETGNASPVVCHELDLSLVALAKRSVSQLCPGACDMAQNGRDRFHDPACRVHLKWIRRLSGHTGFDSPAAALHIGGILSNFGSAGSMWFQA